MRVARSANLPPTVMWGVGEPGVWSPVDLELMRALKLYEDGLCSCGHPLGQTMDIKNTMAFVADQVTCIACQISENKQKSDEAKPGVKRYIRNLMSEKFR